MCMALFQALLFGNSSDEVHAQKMLAAQQSTQSINGSADALCLDSRERS